MKNKFGLILVSAALFLAVAGCTFDRLTGGSDGESGQKTEESKDTSDTKKSSSSSKSVLDSGIPECDELAKYVDDNAEEIEGSIVGKAIILMYKNSILKAIEDGTEKMSDEEKKKFGEICTKTLEQLKENE